MFSLDQVLHLLQLSLEKGKDSSKLNYNSFSYLQTDFINWTGLENIAVLDNLFITPLSDYYLSVSHQKRSQMYSLQDRVLWSIMYMWTDNSFNSLHDLLHSTETLSFSRINFMSIIQHTLCDLATIFKPNIGFVSPSDWLMKFPDLLNEEDLEEMDQDHSQKDVSTSN